MRLAEMLSYADIGQLHELASTYACSCNTNSKNELIQSLLSSIKRDTFTRQQVGELSEEEFNFLMHIVFDARTSFSLEDLRAKAKFSYLEDLEREKYRSLISIALKKGWVFRIPSRNAAVSFAVPEDMRKQWTTAIIRKELDSYAMMEEPSLYRDEGFAIVGDIIGFLNYLQKHDTLTTNEGVIYKRNQLQLLELMSVHEEPVEKGGWRFGYGRHFREYPDRFSLIYDFCFYRGYINEQPGALLHLLPAAEEAVQLPQDLLAIEMFKFWIRLYKRPIPGLAMLVRLICQASEQEWTSEKALVQILIKRLRPFYYDDPENIARNRILKMMIHLGLIRKGQASEQEWGYRTTDWGRTVMDRVEGAAMKSIVLDKKNIR